MGQSDSKVHQYSVPVSDAKENESAVYRCASHPDGLISCPKSGARTLQEIFLTNFNKMANREFIGFKVENPDGKSHYSYLTWAQVEATIKIIGAAIDKLGLAPEKRQYKDFRCRFIGIQSKNCLESILTDIACMCFGFTTMPLYDTLGEEAVQHMFEETEMETLFIAAEQVKTNVKRFKEGKCPFLKNLIVLDDTKLTAENKAALEEVKQTLKVHLFSELLVQFEGQTIPYPKITPEDVAFFSYTSGTTGRPKGAIVTNRNCIALIGGAEYTLYYLTKDSVHLSYLPMAHVFEKVVFMTLAYLGAKYAIYGGDTQKIKDDLELVKPTLFCSVPRMLNKMFDGIDKKIKGTHGLKGFIARRGLNSKLHGVEKHGTYTDGFYDKLVFNKTKQLLGGRCEVVLSASAPLSVGVKAFLKAAFCCPVIEGYGQTEGMGGQFVQDVNDPNLDSVGGPLPMNEFKLVDVPEMRYTHKDVDEDGKPAPRGEIWFRGPNVIPGYYKNDEKNKETFEDGWLKSGDIGMIVPGSNALKIIDRKKNIFKLAHGEYVAPEKLEQIYKNTSTIAEIFVYGNSLKSVLVAIANLDEKMATGLAESQNIKASNFEELCKKPEMVDLIKKELRKTADENHLKGFERIADVHIDPTPFADHDLITSTFKLKRLEAAQHYKPALDKLYKDKE